MACPAPLTIPIDFLDVSGSACGALLPTGRAADRVDDLDVTLIDNGMPVIVVRAADLGIVGNETPAAMEANAECASASSICGSQRRSS